jgi:hypothetical protein
MNLKSAFRGFSESFAVAFLAAIAAGYIPKDPYPQWFFAVVFWIVAAGCACYALAALLALVGRLTGWDEA